MSEKSRIRWLCRRGMKELDVLLERFFVSDYDGLSEGDEAEFVVLLQQEDPDLWAMIMGRTQAENEAQSRLLDRIREFERAP